MKKFLLAMVTLIVGVSTAWAQQEPPSWFDDAIVPPHIVRDYQGPYPVNDTPDPDILIVYTQQAIDRAGGDENVLRAKILAADEYRKQAYVNSHMTIQPGLTYLRKVDHVENADMVAELSWIETDPGIAALRTEVGGDIVAEISGASGPWCGVGYLLTSMDPENKNWAHSVTHVDCLPSTFAHEVGHNQGCHHDPDNSSILGVTNYAFGHRVCANPGFHTIMSYPCVNGFNPLRIQYYSNPDVSYLGMPTGTWADDCNVFGACRDCARAISETATFVAAYMERPVSVTTTTQPVATTTTVTVPPPTTTSTTTTTLPLPHCGNGIRDDGEQCDGNQMGGCKYGCTAECACVGGKPGWGRRGNAYGHDK